jgi:hypothetical protein
MKTNLNEALNELKLGYTNYHPNLNEILSELKVKETNYYRAKVISLSEAIIKNPNDRYQQVELNSSLNQLERLFSA